MSAPGKKIQRRAYEKAAISATMQIRQIIWFWARRCRKSTNLGGFVFGELSKGPGRMAVAASASLLLGSELVNVTMNQAEAAHIADEEAKAMHGVLSAGATDKDLNLQVADSSTGKLVPAVTDEQFSEMYKNSRLEWRLYFDNTSYSRLQVIAPDPVRARSWRALVIRDEVGYTKPGFELALQVATDAMMRDTPDLRMIYASNLSMDDRHPFFEMTTPRDVTAPSEDEQFPANPKGHFYIGQTGMMVHRVALKDAYAAGHLLYDDHGTAMTYDQCRVFPSIKLGWNISYALNHVTGGAAVIDLLAMIQAQRHGQDQCSFVFVDSEADFREALRLLCHNLKGGVVTIGADTASTTGETSNPFSVTVMEKNGTDYPERLVVLWKEKKPEIIWERLRAICSVIEHRPAGGRAKCLVVDASNERLFCEQTVDELAGVVPVILIVASKTVEPPPPGYDKTKPCNYKTYQGDNYAAAVNDGRVPLPADPYLKTDHRLVVKDAGRYTCEVQPNGMHGDTFDSGKQAYYGHHSTVESFSAEQIRAMHEGQQASYATGEERLTFAESDL